MPTPKQVGERVWRRAVNELYQSLYSIRNKVTHLLELIQERPIPVRLCAIYIGQVLSAVGETVELLQRLEEIADKDPRIND